MFSNPYSHINSLFLFNNKNILKSIQLNNNINNLNENENNKDCITNFNENIDNYDNVSYLSEINNFCNLYNSSIDNVLNNPKIEYRYFCFRYLNYINNITLPKIYLNKILEAVLIEFRCFNHIEFIIRNNIIKLGSDWSQTVVCGNLNYDFIKDLTKNISENIKIIKVNYDSMDQSSYSKLLSSIDFWNNFIGEKILIYQEDSCIFNFNINDFLKWDYIGAPWPKNQNDNINLVGNGGFSLRSKNKLIDVINKISIEDTIVNSSTIEYITNANLKMCPEDVYFSLNMLKYNIGIVADWDSAFNFSSETQYNPNSLGGHNFWLSNSNWKNLLYQKVIKKLNLIYHNNWEHRGGWSWILKNLIKNDLINKEYDENSIDFYDIVEQHFMWNNYEIINKRWIGVIHNTFNCPVYLKKYCDIKLLLENNNFLNSLKNCLFIITLSNYLSEFLISKFKELNINVRIYFIKHPVIQNNIKKFNLSNYLSNNNKYIIQIGQQLRKMTSIYKINIFNHKRLWLTGTKDFEKIKTLFDHECKFLNLNLDFNSIEVRYSESDEYDELLIKNIVLLDLFDASANNTLLECIVRNTPIFVKKLPATIEYLGENYPLYFNEIEEIYELFTYEKIKNGTDYLKNMNKDDISIDYFKRFLFTKLNYIY